MVNDKKIVQSDDLCACSIEGMLEDKNEENRLCSSSSNDVEVFVDPDPERISQKFYLKRMTDGLPIIPPTKDRVLRLLKYTDLDPDETIAVLPPKMGIATPEKIAVNSVMAGCLPQFMPFVLNCVKSLSSEKFNIVGINATTHPVAMCTILNGPLSREIGAGSGAGCLGPGNLANATIGRAIRFCMINIAGAIPGVGDHATMGSPAKYSYTFAENEAENPWESLSVERGFDPSVTTSTVLALEAPQNVNDHRSKTATDLLETIAKTASTPGCNNSHVPGEFLLIMSPEHAKTIYNDGFTKQDVKEYLYERCVVDVRLADRGGRKIDSEWIVEDKVRITRSPEDIVLVVAGGVGRHSMISHGFGTSSESVTLPIKLKNGVTPKSVEDFKK